jgi:hypothetical protein
MKTLVFSLALLAGHLSVASHSHAATEQECLKALALGKRLEQESRAAHAVYQQEKTEISRCAFLGKSRKHLTQTKKTAEICQAYEPELTAKLKADIVSGLKALDSPNNTCNSKSKADLLAEKRCMDAQNTTKAKNEIFQRAQATYNNNKNNQTLCSWLKVSVEYFNEAERAQKLCESASRTDEPSKTPEIRRWIQQTKMKQKDLCK